MPNLSDLKELIDFLTQGFRENSMTVIVTACLTAWITYAVCTKLYGQNIQTQKINSQALKDQYDQRITQKDDLIAEYRERLHLAPTDTTSVSALSNDELKKKTLILSSKIIEFIKKTSKGGDDLFSAFGTQLEQTTDTDKALSLRHEQIRNSIKLDNKSRQYFETNFKADAIMLKEELQTRLPNDEFNRDRVDFLYQSACNSLCYGEIATDLERLANLLPCSGENN